MQSPWRATLNKGDMVRIPQNTFLWTFKDEKSLQYDRTRLITEPLYALIMEDFDSTCKVLLNGESWLVSKNYLYPGS